MTQRQSWDTKEFEKRAKERAELAAEADSASLGNLQLDVKEKEKAGLSFNLCARSPLHHPSWPSCLTLVRAGGQREEAACASWPAARPAQAARGESGS
jgi:hypothetical protein